jgi:hypothetical protein
VIQETRRDGTGHTIVDNIALYVDRLRVGLSGIPEATKASCGLQAQNLAPSCIVDPYYLCT